MKNNKKQFVMVTREFGSPIFIAPLNGKLSGANVTASESEAEKWDERDAGNPHRLDYHKVVTGYKQLKFEEIKETKK